MNAPDEIRHGIRANLGQFLHQLFQVLLVGMTIGMTRTVVPAARAPHVPITLSFSATSPPANTMR